MIIKILSEFGLIILIGYGLIYFLTKGFKKSDTSETPPVTRENIEKRITEIKTELRDLLDKLPAEIEQNKKHIEELMAEQLKLQNLQNNIK